MMIHVLIEHVRFAIDRIVEAGQSAPGNGGWRSNCVGGKPSNGVIEEEYGLSGAFDPVNPNVSVPILNGQGFVNTTTGAGTFCGECRSRAWNVDSAGSGSGCFGDGEMGKGKAAMRRTKR